MMHPSFGEVNVGTQSAEHRSPPWLPFKTFLNFLDMLSATVVPPRIDASVMSKYPGSIKAQLRSALAYIDAIDGQGIVQPAFKELVKARGTDMWRNTFAEQFWNWYRELLGDLDTDSATISQLRDRFKAVGVEGSVMIKAMRFFLAALDETGVTYSPHFKVRGALTGAASAPRPKKPKAARTRGADDAEPAEAETPIPVGFNKLSLPLNGDDNAVLILPKEMKADEWAMLSAYVRMFYRYDKPGKA